MEISIPPISDEYRARASVARSILEALEAGEAPADWIEQLDRAGIGSLGERWGVSRFLGAKACEVNWETKKRVRLATVLFDWPSNPEWVGPPLKRETLRVEIPSYNRYASGAKCDRSIVDCLETAARIAFTQGKPQAVRLCLEAMAQQHLKPTIKSVTSWDVPKTSTGKSPFRAGVLRRRQAPSLPAEAI